MKALLLAAGEGIRLRPLTYEYPKCLMPICGVPLLCIWLDQLEKAGFSEVVINLHYMAEEVQRVVDRVSTEMKISTVYEESLLGTGGTILLNRELFGDEVFLVAHADNICLADFSAFLARHRSRPEYTEMTMMLFETDQPESCGIVELDDFGVVQRFHEKVPNPPGHLANAAVYILESSALDEFEGGGAVMDFSKDVVSRMTGRIYSFMNDVYHRDIGSVGSYAQAQLDIYRHHTGILGGWRGPRRC